MAVTEVQANNHVVNDEPINDNENRNSHGRHGTPNTPRNPLPYQDVLNRPRSNPRSRTPMRYESPLNADAFRRDSVVREDEEEEEERRSRSAQRTTVRPLIFAGAPVGGTLRRNIIREENHNRHQRDRVHYPSAKSSKQGPSRRKVRRWNNDSFTGLTSEFANRLSVSGVDVAQLYLKAQADASKHLCVYQPTHPTKSSFQTLFDESRNNSLKEKFWKGEIAPSKTMTIQRKCKEDIDVPRMMLKRLHGRLRNIVDKMHTSSRSVDTITTTESFIIQLLLCKQSTKQDDDLIDEYWKKFKDSMFERPKLIQQSLSKKEKDNRNEKEERISSKRAIQFTYKKDAGLSRLFLHAVCQFHKLEVCSLELVDEEKRCLMVSGEPDGVEYRLMDLWKTSSSIDQ